MIDLADRTGRTVTSTAFRRVALSSGSGNREFVLTTVLYG